MPARKLPIVIVVLALCGALAMVGIALGATATRVTIQGGGGEYFGYVKSSKLKCKSNRKVKLYKQLGSDPKPSQDKFINSDLAQANGNGYQWNTGSTGVHHGKVYAHVSRITGCRGDNSRTIHAS
jgi:hypothetical protein